MDYAGRENFWRVLNSISDRSGESLKTLREVSIAPDTLCRYRTVSESSLLQLQENKQYFSTANYYDDPFDTYFKIDFQRIQNTYEMFKSMLLQKNYNLIKSTFDSIGITKDLDKDIPNLLNQPLDISKLNMSLKDVRDYVQRQINSICFCENPLNETMWMKYANNHKGFVQVYDFNNPTTLLCGTESKCALCEMHTNPPYPFPVYYSDEKYDATIFALGSLIIQVFGENISKLPVSLLSLLNLSLVWQKERASLIKKECHHYDEEWRLLSPVLFKDRSCIKLKPKSVLIGFRTPNYESKLIISAAKIAGIENIYKVFINDNNDLDKKFIYEV